ncbi:MAG TPA: hypothetical protein VFH78_04560 [Candidatus Thermoplasmatota archaeon]|nr:hypothetical protein [Candidatus Thermoplasmatota archaeon]
MSDGGGSIVPQLLLGFGAALGLGLALAWPLRRALPRRARAPFLAAAATLFAAGFAALAASRTRGGWWSAFGEETSFVLLALSLLLLPLAWLARA